MALTLIGIFLSQIAYKHVSNGHNFSICYIVNAESPLHICDDSFKLVVMYKNYS